ncbi:hypothetical protein, partial [Bacteroides xylanisolvens]|uniref:hypothetical protein n=1 Tax=Bacteroides xylanisolvens TaxID=371601 RepID=UPI001AA0EE54
EQGYTRLEPGMAVTAKIKIGQPRVIEYLLSPLLRYRQEAWTERRGSRVAKSDRIRGALRKATGI